MHHRNKFVSKITAMSVVFATSFFFMHCGQKELAELDLAKVELAQSIVKLQFSDSKEQRFPLWGPANRMLSIDQKGQLVLLEPNGATHLLAKDGSKNLLYGFSEIERTLLRTDTSDFYRPSKSVVWNISPSKVAVLFLEQKTNSWRRFEAVLPDTEDKKQSSQIKSLGAIKPLAFADTGFMAYQGNKILRFSFAVNRIQSSGFTWPLPQEKPITGGLDATSNYAWALTDKSLVLWNFSNGNWKSLQAVIDTKIGADLKVVAWASKSSDFANGAIVDFKISAALTSKEILTQNILFVEPIAEKAVPSISIFNEKIRPLAARACENCHSKASFRAFKETQIEANWGGDMKARLYQSILTDAMPKNSKLETEDKKTLLDFLKP